MDFCFVVDGCLWYSYSNYYIYYIFNLLLFIMSQLLSLVTYCMPGMVTRPLYSFYFILTIAFQGTERKLTFREVVQSLLTRFGAMS